jgi:hypothetical protein
VFGRAVRVSCGENICGVIDDGGRVWLLDREGSVDLKDLPRQEKAVQV